MSINQSQIIAKIEEIKLKHFQFQDEINIDNFVLLINDLQQLESTLSLSKDQIQEIFEVIDHNEDGLASLEEVDQLLNTILPIYHEIETNQRGSLYFDPSEKRFTYSITKAGVNNAPKKKITSKILDTLSLDKLSELKFIYYTADRDNRGFADFTRIKKLGEEMSNQLNLTPYEVESIFSVLSDESTNRVSIDYLSRLLCELEKRIFNHFNQDVQSPEINQNFGSNVDLQIPNSDSDEDLEDNEINFQNVYQSIGNKFLNLIVEKIDEGLSLKIKNPNLTKVFQDIIKIKKALEEKLISMEDKLENFFKKYQDLKGMEDMTTTKIKSLEFDLKRQFLMRESLETENDKLAQENRELMEKCLKIDRLNQDIIRKNTEIYSLEAKIQTQNKNIEEIKQKMLKDEIEKNRALENYKLLIEMNRKNNEKEEDQKSKELDSDLKEIQKNSNKKIDHLKSLYDLKEKEYQELLEDNSELISKYQILISEYEESQNTILSLKNENQNLESQISTLKEDLEFEMRRKPSESILDKGVSTLRSSFAAAGFSKAVEFGSIFNDRISVMDKFNKTFQLPIIDENQENLQIPIVYEDSNKTQFNFSFNPEYKIYENENLIKEEKKENEQDQNNRFTFQPDKEIKQEIINIEQIKNKEIKQNDEIKLIETNNNEIKELNNQIDTKDSKNILPEKILSKPEEKDKIPKKKEDQLFEKIMSNYSPRKKTKESNIEDDFKVISSEDKQSIVSPPKKSADNINISKKQNRITDNKGPETRFLQFDEASLFARDYLGIREDPRIIEILKTNDEDLLNFTSFSDYMFRINQREHKEKRIIFITTKNIYNIHPKKFTVLRKVPLEYLTKIFISDKSAILLVMYFKDYDYLIESYRRADLVLYLLDVFKKRGLPQFIRDFGSKFIIKNRGASNLKSSDQYNKMNFNPNLQGFYKTSKKVGYLFMRIGKFIISWDWKEYLFVLLDNVLLCYRDYDRNNPKLSIYFLDLEICEFKSDREHSFKLFNTDQEFLLSAKSYAEQNEWIDALNNLKREFSKKKL